jgi:hypothetical protein
LGWTNGGLIWITTRGGDILLGDEPGVDCDKFNNSKIASRGFGLLDIGCAFASDTPLFDCRDTLL